MNLLYCELEFLEDYSGNEEKSNFNQFKKNMGNQFN